MRGWGGETMYQGGSEGWPREWALHPHSLISIPLLTLYPKAMSESYPLLKAGGQLGREVES